MTSDAENAIEIGSNQHLVFYKVGDRRLRFAKEAGVGAGMGTVEVCVDPFPRWYSTIDYSTLGEVSEDQRLQIIKNVRSYVLKYFYRCKFVNKGGEEVVRLDDK